MTNDLDQALELVSGFVLALFLLPFFMAWLEGSLNRQPGQARGSSWRAALQHLPTRWTRKKDR